MTCMALNNRSTFGELLVYAFWFGLIGMRSPAPVFCTCSNLQARTFKQARSRYFIKNCQFPA